MRITKASNGWILEKEWPESSLKGQYVFSSFEELVAEIGKTFGIFGLWDKCTVVVEKKK